MSFKQTYWAVCVGLFFLASAGCTKTKQNKNLVRILFDTEVRSFDSRYGTDANSQYVADLIGCALVRFDENGTTVGNVAKSWKWTKPTELRVQLKKGIQYSDGTTLTSKDVEATYIFFGLKKKSLKPSPRAGAFKTIRSVQAISDHEVVFTLEKPDASFLTNLVISIYPQSRAFDDAYTAKNLPPTCGPFYLDKATSNKITLKTNEKYTLGPKPKIEGVEFLIVRDETTRFAKLRKGEADVLQNSMDRAKLEGLEKKYPQLSIQQKPALNTNYLGFNFKDKNIQNEYVRKAVSLAIDRQKVIEFVLAGYARPAYSMLPPGSANHYELPNEKRDLVGAKKLLEDAGFATSKNSKKKKLSLTITTTTSDTRVRAAKVLASQLQEAGIDANVRTLEWGKFKADVEKGLVQMWLLGWTGFKDPDLLRYAFHSENAPPNGGNRGWFSDAKLDNKLSLAVQETNTKKRAALYQQIQKDVHQKSPYVFLWHNTQFAVTNKRLSGFKVYADGRYSSLESTSLNVD